jgi:pimeloyl-ACP methyl ester carboxylesterase
VVGRRGPATERAAGDDWRARSAIAKALLSTALLTLAAAGQPAAAPAATFTAASIPVSFKVKNTNTSAVACSSDGADYTVRGHLVAPLDSAGRVGSTAVTLYLHGLGFGEFFWRFQAVPGYDYATQQAEAGYASVVVDRLGYDSSDHPEGTMTCLGAHADVAHQLVSQLRSGAYQADGAAAPTFQKVALAGHSAGGAVAQIEAYSYKDVDALIVASWSEDSSDKAKSTSLETGGVCLSGGEPAEGSSGPGGYAYFGQTPEDFQAVMFHNADAAVVGAATALRNRDPCGDNASLVGAIATNQMRLSQVAVPVLVICGNQDALFDCQHQRDRFSGSADASAVFLENTGHAVTLERTANQFRTEVATWLGRRGFAGVAGAVGAVGADTVAPVVTRPKVTPHDVIVGPKRTPVTLQRKTGARITFSLSETARVSLRIERALAGRRSGRRCVRPRRELRNNRKCTRYKLAGTLRRSGRQGRNSVAFTGRIGKRALRRGRYRLVIKARDAAGNVSKPKRTRFRIV